MAILEISSLSKRFGGIQAVNEASFSIEKGSITGLIGPNGAGKSTLFNLVAGLFPADSGKVIFDGQDITNLPPHKLFGYGLLRTFQLAHEFASLSVRENLSVVPAAQAGENIYMNWIAPFKVREQQQRLDTKADEILHFLNLHHIADSPAGKLSGGQKKLLEIGRTLMADPKIILLDEVGAGINRSLLNEIADKLKQLNSEKGITLCLIEHDMSLIKRVCDQVVVMASGSVLTIGKPEVVQADERVIEAYLGQTDNGAIRRPQRAAKINGADHVA